ncbi:hypothetical protein ACUHMQ_20480 [Chitinimonas sp. PSY-7]
MQHLSNEEIAQVSGGLPLGNPNLSLFTIADKFRNNASQTVKVKQA